MALDRYSNRVCRFRTHSTKMQAGAPVQLPVRVPADHAGSAQKRRNGRLGQYSLSDEICPDQPTRREKQSRRIIGNSFPTRVIPSNLAEWTPIPWFSSAGPLSSWRLAD